MQPPRIAGIVSIRQGALWYNDQLCAARSGRPGSSGGVMESTAGSMAAAPRPAHWRRMRLLADGALLGIAAIWGATFFMVKGVTSSFPVLAFLVIRFVLASLVLLPFALRVRRWPTGQEWKWGLIA